MLDKLTEKLKSLLSGKIANEDIDSLISEFAVLDSEDRNNLSSSDFAYVDSKGGKHLPINDAAHVRNALARFNQTYFESPSAKSKALAKIHAAAAKFDIKSASDLIVLASEDSDTKTRLFNEITEYAEPPASIPFLPRPGSYVHPSYGSISITHERNANFISNFNKAVYQKQIPIDLEHNLGLSGAAGYIKGLTQNSDGSVNASVEWTDMGQEVIKRDRFKYFSPAWRDKWTDPLGNNHTDVVIGGALTTRPFFKEPYLKPIVSSEKGLYFTEGEVNESTSEVKFILMTESDMNVEPIITFGSNPFIKKEPSGDDESTDKKVDGKIVDPANPNEDESDDMPDSMKNKMKGKKMTEDTSKVIQMSEDDYKKFQDAIALVDSLKTANETLVGTVTALTKEARNKRFSEMVIGWPGEPEKNIKSLVALSEAVGEDGEVFIEHVENMRAASEQLKQANLLTEVGSNVGSYSVPTSIDQKLQILAKEIQTRHPEYSPEMAMAEAITQNPQLYTEFENSRSNR